MSWLVVGLLGTLWYPVDGVSYRTEQVCLRSVTDVPAPYTELRCRRTDKPRRLE